MNKKVLLLILDGYGIRKEVHGNAIAQAKKPNIDKLLATCPNMLLEASGEAVGLPSDQMGNSEVGHLNIGAGRIVYTGLSLVNKEVRTKEFFKNEAFLKAINHAKNNNTKLHIMGLMSYGGVHSSLEHIYALIELCNQEKVNYVLHAFADGRDVSPNAFKNDLPNLLNYLKNNNGKLASISGRYYSMDRDQRWERIEKSYQVLIGKNLEPKFNDPIKYVDDQYAKNILDEFLEPALNAQYKTDEITLKDNDSVIFINFRPDRARQMCHMLINSNYYDHKPSTKLNNIFLATLMVYEGINANVVAYPPLDIKNGLGETLEKNNKSQLRIAETEKYAHVTFFFDGGKEINFKNEEKKLISSPKVATYDLQPRMSIDEVCENIISSLGKFDVIIANFANCDMVGHCGKMDKAIEAVEAVDQCIGKILANLDKNNATMFLTADHGNADEMLDKENNVITKHTTAPVFFISTDKNVKFKNIKGKLGNISPTILKYIGVNIPKEMTEEELF